MIIIMAMTLTTTTTPGESVELTPPDHASSHLIQSISEEQEEEDQDYFNQVGVKTKQDKDYFNRVTND